jgi:hypothetical protein
MSNSNEWNQVPNFESPDPDSVGSGASSDGTQNSGEEDTASGGAPEPAEMTDPNGMPVENPSG